VINDAAPCVCSARKFEHITPLFFAGYVCLSGSSSSWLHSLSAAWDGTAPPSYLASELHCMAGRGQLATTTTFCVDVSARPIGRVTVGFRAFGALWMSILAPLKYSYVRRPTYLLRRRRCSCETIYRQTSPRRCHWHYITARLQATDEDILVCVFTELTVSVWHFHPFLLSWQSVVEALKP